MKTVSAGYLSKVGVLAKLAGCISLACMVSFLEITQDDGSCFSLFV